MILDAEETGTQQQGLACPHCRAFNLRPLEPCVPAHLYAEQGFIVDPAPDQPRSPTVPALRFAPYRCSDPVCACLWLRVERDGAFYGWMLGS